MFTLEFSYVLCAKMSIIITGVGFMVYMEKQNELFMTPKLSSILFSQHKPTYLLYEIIKGYPGRTYYPTIRNK